jgi:hypothetical protein
MQKNIMMSNAPAPVLLLPPALFLLLYAMHSPDVSLIQPDSHGYLTFSGGRSGGYPAFLALLKPLTRDVADYALAQRMLYACAVLVLAHELMRSFGNLAIVFIAELGLLLNPEVNRYHYSILSESLFLSISALFLAAALAYLRTGRLSTFAVASVVAAYAATVRPVGLVLVAALVLLVITGPRKRRPQLSGLALVIALPTATILPLENHLYKARNPGPRVTLLPFHLIAKAGMVEAFDAHAIILAAPQKTKPLQRALENTLAPVRQLIAEAPNRAARCQLILNYEVVLQYEFSLGERALLTEGGTLNPLIAVAVARLKHALSDYLRLSIDHLRCAWSLGAATNEQQTELSRYLESHRPLPFEKPMLALLSGTRAPPLPTLVLLVMSIIAALLLASSVALLFVVMRLQQPSLELALAGTAALIVHGALLLVAVTSVGAPRYLLGLWVPLAIGTGMSVLWIGGAFGIWRSSTGASKDNSSDRMGCEP